MVLTVTRLFLSTAGLFTSLRFMSDFLYGDLSIIFLKMEGDFPFFGSSSKDSLLLPGEFFLGLALSLTLEDCKSLVVLLGDALVLDRKVDVDDKDEDSPRDLDLEEPSLLMNLLTLPSDLEES